MFAFLGIAFSWVEAWVLLRKSPLAVSHIEVTDLQGGGHGYWMEWRRFGGHGVVRGVGLFLLEGKGLGRWVRPSFMLGYTVIFVGR